MFEHLGHVPDVKSIKQKTNYKVYLSFLLFGIMFFLFAYSINIGPSSMAETYTSPDIRVLVNSTDKQVVVDSPQFSVFDFIIKAEAEDVFLKNLKVNTNGLFDIDLFNDLKLYNGSTQIGSVMEIDGNGNIYFILNDYLLQKGDNFFSFILSPNKTIKVGDVLSLGFEDNNNISLGHQEKLFNVKGQFPVNGGLVNVIEKGSLQAFNNFDNPDYITSNTPNVVASFSLTTKGESASLNKLVFEIADPEELLEEQEFILLDDQKLIARSFIVDGEIIFDINKPYRLNSSSQNYFELHAISLPVGEFKLVLIEVQAKGYASGKENILDNRLTLSSVEVVDFIPKFYAGEFKQSLSEGWNTLYALEIKSKGSDDLELNKLTWSLEKFGVNIEQAEIWVDGEPYVTDLIIKDDMIVMKAGWDEALKISKNVEIKLLARVSDVDKGDFVKTHLLVDNQPKVDEDFADNILWSHQGNIFNGYQLPHLPLDPSVLSN